MLLSILNRIKHKFKFTGWLQYIPVLLLALIILGISGLFSFLQIDIGAYIMLFIGLSIFARFIYDLFIVKYKIHPPEAFSTQNNDKLDIFDLMRLRRSCRSFQNRKIIPAHLNKLLKYVKTEGDLSKCALLSKESIRFEYIDAPLTVWPTVGAQEFIVALAPKIYNRLAIIDVGRCLQKIVMHATRMGLATCWIGPGADHKSISKYLGKRFNPKQDHIICVCAIGYKSKYIPLLIRFANFIMNRRFSLSSLFFADSQFKVPLETNSDPFKHFGRCFEICQWAPSSFNAQPTRCNTIIKQGGKNHEISENISRI